MVRLGVNIDHVATIRQARGTHYPEPALAAREAVAGGADQITIHLREDRRHIQDADLGKIRSLVNAQINLEMAASDEIVDIACSFRPHTATIVPERRMELTTEGGLDVAGGGKRLADAVERICRAGIAVSLFIDPDIRQLEASAALDVRSVEFHTGAYCDAASAGEREQELARLVEASKRADAMGMKVCAGHGINYDNARELARLLPWVKEYNIGHAIVARAIFVGMERAVKEMKELLTEVS